MWDAKDRSTLDRLILPAERTSDFRRSFTPAFPLPKVKKKQNQAEAPPDGTAIASATSVTRKPYLPSTMTTSPCAINTSVKQQLDRRVKSILEFNDYSRAEREHITQQHSSGSEAKLDLETDVHEPAVICIGSRRQLGGGPCLRAIACAPLPAYTGCSSAASAGLIFNSRAN